MLWIEVEQGLPDEHGVAVAVEAVSLGDGMRIGAQDVLSAGERAHEHEQRRAREMEIRHQAINDLEVIARVDEQFRSSGGTIVWKRSTFSAAPRTPRVRGA